MFESYRRFRCRSNKYSNPNDLPNPSGAYDEIEITQNTANLLTIEYQILLVFDKIISSCGCSGRVPCKGHKNSAIKEFEDIISNHFCNSGFGSDRFDKTDEEFASMFSLKHPVRMSSYMNEEVDLGDSVRIYEDGAISHTYGDGEVLYTSTHASDFLYLKSLGLEVENCVDIILRYHTARSHSGTNWSPIEGYSRAIEYQDFYTIECYSSPFNNLNYFKRDGLKSDAVLTAFEADNVIPYVKGCFPDAIDGLVQDQEKVLFLINPIYTETEVDLTFDCFKKFMEKYADKRIVVMGTLPYWPDMWTKSKPVKNRGKRNRKPKWPEHKSADKNIAIIKQCNIEINLLTSAHIVNSNISKNIDFRLVTYIGKNQNQLDYEAKL